MKSEQRDPYDIKKFEEVLGESYMMIPDSQGRLRRSLEDLDHCLSSDEFLSKDDNKSEWYQTAQALLKEHLASDNHDEVAETNTSNLKDNEAF